MRALILVLLSIAGLTAQAETQITYFEGIEVGDQVTLPPMDFDISNRDGRQHFLGDVCYVHAARVPQGFVQEMITEMIGPKDPGPVTLTKPTRWVVLNKTPLSFALANQDGSTDVRLAVVCNYEGSLSARASETLLDAGIVITRAQ